MLARERWEGHLHDKHVPAAEVRLKSDRAYQETMGVKQQVAESLAGNVLIAQPPETIHVHPLCPNPNMPNAAQPHLELWQRRARMLLQSAGTESLLCRCGDFAS